jgi:hypothetical protein
MSYSDPCPSLKSVSNHYIILRSMSFQSLVPSNLCPLMSHPDLCPLTSYSDLCIAINVVFLSVQNVDTDLWGYFFWHITLICVLCQRSQIWGNIYFGGHRSEYDVRGHRSGEICFWKDIDLGVTLRWKHFIYICKTQTRVLPSNPCPTITSNSDPCPSKALSPHKCFFPLCPKWGGHRYVGIFL